jgi:hypothetical protein
MNNLEEILPLLNFENSDDKFYFIQIYKRRKDNPEMLKDMEVLNNFYIYTEGQLYMKFPQIQKICDDNNARAYIRLNRRSDRKIALQALARLATMIASDQYKMRNLYDSIAGEFHSETDKTWLIDIDYKDFEGRSSILETIHSAIRKLQIDAKKEPLMHMIPTKNGYHLITRPFNLKMLEPIRLGGTRFDIHKDNPTILYTP